MICKSLKNTMVSSKGLDSLNQEAACKDLTPKIRILHPDPPKPFYLNRTLHTPILNHRSFIYLHAMRMKFNNLLRESIGLAIPPAPLIKPPHNLDFCDGVDYGRCVFDTEENKLRSTYLSGPRSGMFLASTAFRDGCTPLGIQANTQLDGCTGDAHLEFYAQ